MKVSVQFPLLTKSENILRSLPFVVANAAKSHGSQSASKAMGIAHSIADGVKKQRAQVRMIIDSQLPRLRSQVPTDDPFVERRAFKPNFYRVTIIRISAGELDTDGLAGALKAVRDEVAAWLGIDDGPRAPASWRAGQQRGPRKTHAVRIEIEDDDPDQREVHRIVGPPIAQLGPVVGDVQHARRTKIRGEIAGGELPMRLEDAFAPLSEHLRDTPGDRMHARPPSLTRRAAMRAKAGGLLPRNACIVEQEPLIFRRSYYAPPGQDDDADEVTLEELTGPLFEAMEPPPRIIKGGRELWRRRDFHPALGEHWIYEAVPSAVPPTPRSERTEARR